MSVEDHTEAAQSGSASPDPGAKLGLALLVIAAAQLMLVLDDTIVSVALPSMQHALKLAPSDQNWIVTAYALVFGGLLLAGGRAGDIFGPRLVFRIGLVVFSAASLVGGLSDTGTMLIVCRLVQGAGAAIAAPTALSLLATTFPAGEARNKALGIYGAMGGLGSVIGLLLGGALTDYLSWRWVMFINVPIAVAVLLGTGVLVESGRRSGRMDLPGALTVTLGVGALVYGANRAGKDGLSDTHALIALCGAVVLLVAFVFTQRASSAPLIPSLVAGNRQRVGAYLTMLLVGAGMLATFYFLTLYMQVVKGYSPMITGVAYLPFAVGIGLAAGGIGPQLLAKLPERIVVALGLVIAVGGMIWFSFLAPSQNALAVLLPAQLLTGLGLGLVFVTATVVGVRGVAPRDTGIASGLLNTSQQIGGAIGLATLAAVATSVTEHKSASTPHLKALTDGYTDGLLLGGGLYLAALVIALFTLVGSGQPVPESEETPVAAV